MRTFVIALILVLGPALNTAYGQVPPRPSRPPAESLQERHAELERRVRENFLAQVAARLQLTQRQRGQMDAVLRDGAHARRELGRDSRQLRAEMARAVAEQGTPDAAFSRLLVQMAELREREQALERQELERLAEFLSPRQQATFLMLRMQLNERIRGMPRPSQQDGPRVPGARGS
jgi:Spy/CpxP family protein refolding chaperone